VDLRRLRAGEWLAAAGGVAMIVALALPWYEVDSESATGFEAFTVIDVLLTLLALLALALPFLQATRDSPALPVAAAVLTASFGIIGILLVLFRLIDDPFTGSSLQAGAWVGLAAALAIEASGWLSLDNEYVRGLPPDVEPELRPAPRPTAQA
jgi:uncharacterized membrane protein